MRARRGSLRQASTARPINLRCFETRRRGNKRRRVVSWNAALPRRGGGLLGRAGRPDATLYLEEAYARKQKRPAKCAGRPFLVVAGREGLKRRCASGVEPSRRNLLPGRGRRHAYRAAFFLVPFFFFATFLAPFFATFFFAAFFATFFFVAFFLATVRPPHMSLGRLLIEARAGIRCLRGRSPQKQVNNRYRHLVAHAAMHRNKLLALLVGFLPSQGALEPGAANSLESVSVSCSVSNRTGSHCTL